MFIEMLSQVVGAIGGFITLVLILMVLGEYGDFERVRKKFANEFVYTQEYTREIAEALKKMNEELAKTEKELTALIDNK